MIVKVQWPLFSSETNPQCLVYDETRSFKKMIDCTKEIDLAIGPKRKAYFNASISRNGTLVIDFKGKLQDQNW
jgi:hypothetical protein